MKNKFKKLGKTELFVRTITEFKRNILNDTILSLQCILESINRINTDSTITIESITSGEDSYITNYNHYLFTSLRALDKYSGITANDIHYAIQLQDCIMNFVDLIWEDVENRTKYPNIKYHYSGKIIWDLYRTISQYIGNDIEIYNERYNMYFNRHTLDDISRYIERMYDVLSALMEIVNK